MSAPADQPPSRREVLGFVVTASAAAGIPTSLWAMPAMAASDSSTQTLTAKGLTMKEEPTDARKNFGDLAPHLAEITDKVLFGDVWENPALSPRDRSLVTITSLISMYRVNEMPFHLKKALENGLTREEIAAAITHLAFYAGWPPAMTALQIARKTFEEAGK